MRPRDGTRNSMRARPKPRFVIFTIWPRRWPSEVVTMPTWASVTSTITSSTGSHFSPSISFTTTSGMPTAIS